MEENVFFKFDSESLNEYFKKETGRDKFETIEDLELGHGIKVKGKNETLTQHDLDLLIMISRYFGYFFNFENFTIQNLTFRNYIGFLVRFINCRIQGLEFEDTYIESLEIESSETDKNYPETIVTEKEKEKEINEWIESTKRDNYIHINVVFQKNGEEKTYTPMLAKSISSFFKMPHDKSISVFIYIPSFEKLSSEDLESLLKHSDQIVGLSIGSFRGLSVDILEKLGQNKRLKYGVKEDYNGNIFTEDRFYTNEDLKELLQVMEDIKRLIPENATEPEKFFIAYGFLGMIANYDERGAKSSGKSTEEMIIKTRSLKGFFMDGTAICLGFAIAAKYCLEYLGFECEIAEGDKHAWIQVKINGKWYNADLTNDKEYLRDKRYPPYCLKSDKAFKEFNPNLDINQHICDEDYPKAMIKKELKKLRSMFGKYKKANMGKGYKRLVGLEDYAQIAHSTTISHSFLNWIKHTIALWKNEGRENGEFVEDREGIDY